MRPYFRYHVACIVAMLTATFHASLPGSGAAAGMISDFFAGSEDAARAYGATQLTLTPEARRKRYEPAEWGSPSPLDMPLLWATIENVPYDVDRHSLELVQLENDGEAMLQRFPVRLTDLLRELPEEKISPIAKSWVQHEEMQDLEVGSAEKIIRDLRRLAIQTKVTRRALYQWWSL